RRPSWGSRRTKPRRHGGPETFLGLSTDGTTEARRPSWALDGRNHGDTEARRPSWALDGRNYGGAEGRRRARLTAPHARETELKRVRKKATRQQKRPATGQELVGSGGWSNRTTEEVERAEAGT